MFSQNILDTCGWQDVSWSFYSWSRVQASDAVLNSPKAPAYDHTLNNPSGWYYKLTKISN